MGAHHLADTEAARVTRVAGRGALVASTALALTGAGGGLALATPDHGSGDSGHEWGHDSGDEWGHEDAGHGDAWSDTASCDPESLSGLGDTVLDDLGLTSSPDELCGTPPDDGYGDDGHGDDGHGDDGHGDDGHDPSGHDPYGESSSGHAAGVASGAGDGSGAASARPASTTTTTPINPDDIPPAPGETKVIDLPDRPSGQV